MYICIGKFEEREWKCENMEREEGEKCIGRDIVAFRLYRTMDPFPEVERKLRLVVWVGDNVRIDAVSVCGVFERT